MHAGMADLSSEEKDLLERSTKKAKTNVSLTQNDMQMDVCHQQSFLGSINSQNERKSFRDSLLGYGECENQDCTFKEGDGDVLTTTKINRKTTRTNALI